MFDFLKTTSSKYKILLDKLYSKKKVKEEINYIFPLLKKKIELEKKLSQYIDNKDVEELIDTLSLLIERFKNYNRFYKIIKKMSEKYKNKKQSSHLILEDLDKIQKQVKITFADVLNHFDTSLILLKNEHFTEYLQYQKSLWLLDDNDLRKVLKSITEKKSIIFPISIFLLIVFVIFLYHSGRYIVYLNYTKAYYQFLTDKQSVLEEDFYRKFGIRIYAPNDEKIKLIYVLHNLGFSDVISKNVTRIILIPHGTGGFYSPLTKEIIMDNDMDKLDFLEAFFHELGHAIHLNLKNKGEFDKKFKIFFEKAEEIQKIKKGEKYIHFERELGEEYRIFNFLFQKWPEGVARFYAARMFDIIFFYEKHLGLIPLLDIIDSNYRESEILDQLKEGVTLLHEHEFFGKLPLK